uniref:PHF7/G2E3-like PHD zinc finger domain-containing protein n=1 Tax=Phasianus colchicus TaxID=9054 RepID=A0A669P3S8_PHACC
MLTAGIRIPFRRPTWEDNDAYASLRVRHQHCDARDCLSPHGRDWAEREGPWELLLCNSCAAQGTHRRCFYLSHRTTRWDCNTCAGEGTASNTNLDSAGLSTTTRQELGPSRGSRTTSQAPPGSAECSRVPGSSVRSSQRRTDRRRVRLHLHRDENTCNQPRGRRGSCRNSAPIAESSSLRSASCRTSESSRHSQNLATTAGADRDSGPGHKAALRCSARPQILQASPKHAVGADRHQHQVLRAAPTATPHREHRGAQGILQRLMAAGPITAL